MSKFWLFMGILFAIVFVIAVGCAVSPEDFRPWFVGGMIYIFGEVAVNVNAWWVTVSANPVYQQWHMLIWFAGGIVGTVIFAKVLWPRRPRLRTKPVIPKTYQHDLEAKLPQSVVEPVPEKTVKPLAKTKEAVVAPEPKAEEAIAP